MILDDKNNPVFAYHKYDEQGNLQFYTAQIKKDKWIYTKITDWDYRWWFEGNGSINSEVRIKGFTKRNDSKYEVDYWHIKYGNGTILLNDNFEAIGKVLKPEPFGANMQVEGTFPGLQIRTENDLGKAENDNFRYVLKWETINRNRDKPREKPWPEASKLYLHKLKTQ
jgi:hypothetical protein